LWKQRDHLRRKLAELEAENRQLEIGWRQSNERFYKIFDATPNPMAITRIKDGFVLDLNEAFADFTGFHRDELVGHAAAVFDLVVDPAKRDAPIHKLHQHGNITDLEVRVRSKSGESLPALFSSDMITMNDEPCMLSTAIGLNGHKKAAKGLPDSRNLLSDILDGSPIPQFVIDKNHRIVKWNKALEEYSGIEAADMVGTDQHWKAFYSEKRPLMADLLVSDAIETVPQWYAGKYSKSKMVNGAYEAIDFFPAMGIDGKWLYFTASAIKDVDGNVIGAVETLKDITEKKRADEKLRKELDWHDAIFEGSRDAIFISDGNSMIVDANEAAARMTGYSKNELLRMRGSDLNKETDLAKFELIRNHILEGEDVLEEATILAKDGRKLDVEFGHHRILIAGEPYIHTVARDVTPRKQLEAQLLQVQKMEAIGALAGGIAHDFNNLLSIVGGYADVMIEEIEPDHPLRRDLAQIMKATQKGAQLTSQLLAFSQKQTLQSEILNLNEIVDDLTPMITRLIGEDISLTAIKQPDIGFMNADQGQIQQIIMNFAVNARDAMPNGGNLSIETANVEISETIAERYSVTEPGSYIMLSVSDTGIGMNTEVQTRIFEPFFTTKKRGKGTGLGLSTVYGIVKQSHGSITVSSEPGKGTTFKIFFPRE
jgi:two-component system, cell cycle sensor histidine kinase and response regulator CckA